MARVGELGGGNIIRGGQSLIERHVMPPAGSTLSALTPCRDEFDMRGAYTRPGMGVRHVCLVPLLLILGACGPVGRGARGSIASPAPVVVTVVIDQQAAWLADARWPLLPASGGFARLRREGTWVHRMVYDHAVTLTAPGHAALYTGSPPRETGIFANDVPDDQGGHVSILRDEATHVIAADLSAKGISSSAARLRVPTLADRLRDERPDAVVVSVSLKDRGAICFGGGHHPDAVIWFDTTLAAFVTSSAFATGWPAWADGFGPSVYAPWQILDPSWIAGHALTADSQVGEGDYEGYGVVFPHDFNHAHKAGGAFRASPQADAAVLALGLAALDHVRSDRAPMLLALSLSANDYINHFFGPDSWEAWDQLLRLDGELAGFMDELDRRYGADGWSMVLTGDHGGINVPEVVAGVTAVRPWCDQPVLDLYQRPCGEMHRIFEPELAAQLEADAARVAGPGHWILAVIDPYVYFTPAARALPADRWAALVDAVTRDLRSRPEVRDVVSAVAPPSCPGATNDDSLAAVVCQSIPTGIDTQLYVVVRPGAFFDTDYVPGRGTNHGSPYLYDRSVPLLVRAPGRVAAGAEVGAGTACSYTLFARTAAALLGVGWRSDSRDCPLVGAGGNRDSRPGAL